MKSESILTALVEIIIESYRLEKAFKRLVNKIDFSEHTRYTNQIAWFDKKILEATEGVGLRIIDLEGKIFDEGMPVTPLNIDEFGIDDTLVIEHMLEPTIVFDDKIYRTGTAILGRVT